MPDTTEPSLKRRLAWFFGIAAASGLAMAAAAEVLRWLLLH
ncbi:MAG: hypothetical protein ACXU82_05365 [Caulobacteraceae bacterium]